MSSIPQLRLVEQTRSHEKLVAQAKAAAVDALRCFVDLVVADGAKFDAYESTTLTSANEVTQQVLAQQLQTIEQSFGDEVRVNGDRYRRHQPGEGVYHSLCGDLKVNRYTYRLASKRNGPTVVPLELTTGIIYGATPAFAFAVAQGIAKMPSRQFEEEMRAMYRQPSSRSTLERLGKNIGGAASQDVVAIETRLRQQEKLPEGAHALSVGLDRTTTPMIEERPASQPPSSRRKKRRKPYVRRPPHPFDVMYRMAYVGTVTITDDSGEALVTRRYAATAEEGPDELVARVMADVLRARAQDPKLPIVVVQDGAAELWGLIWNAFRKAGIRDYKQAIDRFHLNERLATVLGETEKDEAKRREQYDRWQHILDVKYNAPEQLGEWAFAQAKVSQGRRQQAFSSLMTYVSGNERRMRYCVLQRRGLPTASSITEGACKSLITVRAKGSGQRWYQDGLNAVLTLRAIHQSDRLPLFWRRFVRRYEATVTLAA